MSRFLLPLLGIAVTMMACERHIGPEDSPADVSATRPSETLWNSSDDDVSMPAHADEVADYTLRAVLDPIAHTVHGEGTITWRNASSQPVQRLWVHLYLNAFKNERSAFFRERVGGRGSQTPEEWGWIDVRRLALRQTGGPPVELWQAAELHGGEDDDETDASVALPRAIEPGERITLEVAFDDKLPVVVERTGYRGSFHMVAQWFPKIARLEPDGHFAHFAFHHLSEFYSDFGDYDVTLDVPERFLLGATGPVIEQRVTGGRRVERHLQKDIHDFAWTAWDRWKVERETIDGVDVKLLYPPGVGLLAQRELAALRFALPYFSARYGRYPYPVLTVVHPQEDAGESGEMEYPTLITTGGAWFTPPGVLTPEIVTVHELGHQWFYGLVATNEYAWPFLDEGLTQFAEMDSMGAWRGAGSAADIAGITVSDVAINAVGSNMSVHDEPVAQAADAFASGGNYGRLVYARTAAALETLARVYGRDATAQALGRYARRFRFQHPGPEQLLTTFEEVLGNRAATALRAALFDKGWVDYRIEGVWSERMRPAGGVFDRNGGRETIPVAIDSRFIQAPDGGMPQWDNTAAVRRRGTLSFPVDVDLLMADGSRRRESWSGVDVSKRFAWQGSERLVGVFVDPEDRIVIDANLENNQAGIVGEGSSARRTLENVTYWVQLALQTALP